MNESRIYSFPPIIDERATVLIAGTAPSVKSLEYGQFYGHPQNYFWRVIYGLYGDGTGPDADYRKRLSFLQSNGLALWDVIESCLREGSLDANIKGELPNDFPGLLQSYSGIRCIAFNGGKAYDTFRKHFRNRTELRDVVLLKLPSTSPIPTKAMRNLNDRIEAWRPILSYR